MLERGFWLSVWRIEAPVGERLYVGRTGDSSSVNAAPPFQRMAQHFGRNTNQNALHTHLGKNKIAPRDCTLLELVAHGPIFREADDWPTHQRRRDAIAAMEQALEKDLRAANYQVLNTINNKKPLDVVPYAEVRAAFAEHFPGLHTLPAAKRPT
jgi:hypothetical protein